MILTGVEFLFFMIRPKVIQCGWRVLKKSKY